LAFSVLFLIGGIALFFLSSSPIRVRGGSLGVQERRERALAVTGIVGIVGIVGSLTPLREKPEPSSLPTNRGVRPSTRHLSKPRHRPSPRRWTETPAVDQTHPGKRA
jgi:hypothetical protein